MARWGLFVEETVGSGDRKHWEVELLGHVDGTREDALRELEDTALRFKPAKPFSVRRSRLYRTEDGFLQTNDGVTTTYHCRFSVAEMVRDSKNPSAVAKPSLPQDRVPGGS
ncbi:MAG: hypothetical protein QOF84_1043 [Streptomyces sp.]|jgi:hypothetical protein|nr:hypothetical protein [Streptomyces sp.]